MDAARLKQRLPGAAIVALITLGAAMLLLLAQTARSPAEFGRLQALLLAINATGGIVLLAVIVLNLMRLVRDYRNRVPGSRLKAKLVIMFLVLSVAPLGMVYIFAVQFLNRGVASWFDPALEGELTGALQLSRASLDVELRTTLATTRQYAALVADLSDDRLPLEIGELRREAGAREIAVFGENQRIVAISSESTGSAMLTTELPDDVALQVRQTGIFVGLEPDAQSGYQIRAAVRLAQADGRRGRIFQALFPVNPRLGSLADSVQSTYTRYSELRFLREPLTYATTMTLSLIVLLALLAAVYGAFFFSRRLAAPVESLVAGTRAVAEGDFGKRLPVSTRDEVGFLIQSFNEMVQYLENARGETRFSQQQLEKERANLAAILARLSTGVIAIGPDRRLRLANAAAGATLQVDLAGRTGATLDELAKGHPLVDELLRAWEAHLSSGELEWRGQVTLRTETGRRILNCASTALPGADETGSTRILVFDDVTSLLQAQRDAAWGEVARRLAHEIKNPLTPIRLAAERIRRKYLASMQPDEALILDRSTHTIVQQVEAMRDMVNAFSEYARAPELTLARFELNQLVREVAYLYRTQENQPAVHLRLDEQLGVIDADPGRIRQLLHNLIRNALEATEAQADARIEVCTGCVVDDGRGFAEITVSDNGPGIAPGTLPQIFEPYVTTKKKGTGLGLAIVKKLTEEHGGTVKAENRPDGGARITVRLPRVAAGEDKTTEAQAVVEPRRERA